VGVLVVEVLRKLLLILDVPHLELFSQRVVAARCILALGVCAWCLLALLLLQDDSVKLDVRVVHNQVFSEEAFELVAIDDVEFVVRLEASHEPQHVLFVLLPFFAVLLDLHLRLAQLLVELLKVVFGVKHLAVFSYLLQ